MLIGYRGRPPQVATPREIADRLAAQLGGTPIVLPDGPRTFQAVGVISGGAGDMLEQSADAGLDCYVTGEPAHFCHQIAREVSGNVVFLGHHHSEKLGVQALGRLLTEKLGLECASLDISTLSAADYAD